jgi:hypothetical protein
LVILYFASKLLTIAVIMFTPELLREVIRVTGDSGYSPLIYVFDFFYEIRAAFTEPALEFLGLGQKLFSNMILANVVSASLSTLTIVLFIGATFASYIVNHIDVVQGFLERHTAVYNKPLQILGLLAAILFGGYFGFGLRFVNCGSTFYNSNYSRVLDDDDGCLHSSISLVAFIRM